MFRMMNCKRYKYWKILNKYINNDFIVKLNRIEGFIYG